MNPLEKIDISIECRVVANLVSNTSLLEQTHEIVDPTLFESALNQIVVEWTIDYFKQFKEAPGKNLKDVFANRSSELNEADAQLVYAYLHRGDWTTTSNIEFAKKELQDYLQERFAKRCLEKMKTKIESGNFKGALDVVADLNKKPEVSNVDVIDFANSPERLLEAWEDKEKPPVFILPGDLGKTLGGFVLDDYVYWMGAAKSGKSWFLEYCALQSALQGNDTLYISLEMDPLMVLQRFGSMLDGMMQESKDCLITQFVPRNKDVNGNNLYEKCKTYRTPNKRECSLEQAKKTLSELLGKGKLRIMTRPTKSYSVANLETDLKKMEIGDSINAPFVPKVVVIDYADIMKFDYRGDGIRLGLVQLSQELRRLNRERHFCLITASQGGRENLNGRTDIKESNVAESMGKINDATKVILINRTPSERREGIYRISMNTVRGDGPAECTCFVTGCLSVGKPVMDSHMSKYLANS